MTGACVVFFVLALNVARTDGAIALAASAIVAGYLYFVWVRRGRPAGVGEVEIAASQRSDRLRRTPPRP